MTTKKLVAVLATLFAGVLILASCSFDSGDNKGRTSQEAEPSRDLLALCKQGKFSVRLDENLTGNLISQGLSEDPEKFQEELLTYSACEPRVLHAFYNASPLGEVSPIKKVTDIAPLKKDAEYTQQGKDLYWEWSAYLKANAKIEKANLPSQGVNTGAVPNGEVFQAEGLIPEGTAVRIQYYQDGRLIGEHLVRLECGNPIGWIPHIGGPPPGAPSIVTPPPPGETTETPPPPVTKTPPPTTLSPKTGTQAPGNGGKGDGASGKYGGQGNSRGTAPNGPVAPTGGVAPPVNTPQPKPKPNPVPDGTPAPSTTPQAPATGAQPSDTPGGSVDCTRNC